MGVAFRLGILREKIPKPVRSWAAWNFQDFSWNTPEDGALYHFPGNIMDVGDRVRVHGCSDKIIEGMMPDQLSEGEDICLYKGHAVVGGG